MKKIIAFLINKIIILIFFKYFKIKSFFVNLNQKKFKFEFKLQDK